MNPRKLALFVSASLLLATAARADSVWLSSLDLANSKVTDKTQPAADKTIDGQPLAINGNTFEHGVCFHGDTVVYVMLDGGTDRFTAVAGVDDEIAPVPPQDDGRRGGAGQGGARQGGRGRGAAP